MSSSSYSSLSFEACPKMLKDFLIDDMHSKSNKPSPQLLRSRSKAASSTIFAIHKASEIVTKALKYLPFASIKSSSILPKSISGILSRKEKYHYTSKTPEVSVKVKVKDILRWRSFKDLVEDKCIHLDLHCSTQYNPSPNRFVNDFGAQDFSSWCYEGVSDLNFMKTTRMIDMDHKTDEEYEQHTPISILNSPFYEDQNTHQKEEEHLINYDQVEEKAYELLVNNFEIVNMENNNNQLLFDFFKHELTFSRNCEKSDDAYIIKLANNWLNEEYEELFEWELIEKRENYVREMVRWNNLEQEEHEAIILQLESLVIDSLLDELLTHLIE